MKRRTLLKTAAVGGTLLAGSTFIATSPSARRLVGLSDPGIGFIGAGIRFHSALKAAMDIAPGVAIADVDMLQLGRALQVARDKHRETKRPINTITHEDYRHVLDNKNVNVVFIGSPDHWHAKQAIDAMRAGKDVYCEKPATLTIDEGIQMEKVMQETGRIIQVGTQQRTEFDQQFAKAAAIVRANRLGKISRVTVCVGGGRTSGTLPEAEVPRNLNWDLWQGQAPEQTYRSNGSIADTDGWGAGFPLSRTHRYYRWFYEYSGGKLTDWGAHHLDIALLALDKLSEDIGKVKIDVQSCTHPVSFDDNGMPTQNDRFNTATSFSVKLTFEDGNVIYVRNSARLDLGFTNGIMFEGEKGRMLVNRGKLVGKPVEELEKRPLPEGWYAEMFGQEAPTSHIEHFFECVHERRTPISDLKSHNLMLNLCHAINIAMRLNRSVTYDPAARNFGDDPQANNLVKREQRSGFEITV